MQLNHLAILKATRLGLVKFWLQVWDPFVPIVGTSLLTPSPTLSMNLYYHDNVTLVSTSVGGEVRMALDRKVTSELHLTSSINLDVDQRFCLMFFFPELSRDSEIWILRRLKRKQWLIASNAIDLYVFFRALQILRLKEVVNYGVGKRSWIHRNYQKWKSIYSWISDLRKLWTVKLEIKYEIMEIVGIKSQFP